MMFTARMKYLVAVVLDRHSDAVTKELLSLSLLHFVKVQELQAGLEKKVNSVVLTVSATRLQDIRKRIESFLNVIQTAPVMKKDVALDLAALKPVDLDAAEKMLTETAGRIQGFRDRQKAIQQEILKLEDIKRQVLLFGDLRASLQAGSQYSFLNFQAGTVPAARFDELKKEVETFPSVVLTFHQEDDNVSALIITMKRDDARINLILEEGGFRPAELTQEMMGVKDEVTLTLDKKISALSTEQHTLNVESESILTSQKDRLLALWEDVKLNELYTRIQSFFSRTARTVLFSGWVPAAKQAVIEEAVTRLTGGSCYLEWRDPAGLEKETHHAVPVPVQLKNMKFLSPFQMLVTNFSTPQYGTINPTPIIAVVYLAMFGMMFADVGQGAVLMLVGILGTLFGKFKKGMTELVKLAIYCGAASILGGVLFGSFFGFTTLPISGRIFILEHLLEPGGQAVAGAPVTNILQVLVLTLYFGIGVIALGLVLNWINCIRMKNWVKLIFDRTGLVGGWMYAGAVYAGYTFAASDFKSLPGETALLFGIGLPALLFLVKPAAEFIEHRAHHPEMKFTVFTPVKFLLEWVIEMLEFFAGYLSNTLSFMRVAGLGIAHAALMMAFFAIANLLGNGEGVPGFSALSYAVVVIGNVFVIALEGLSAGIQSLRLNYYEFFSKYFRGSGEAYTPVSLQGP